MCFKRHKCNIVLISKDSIFLLLQIFNDCFAFFKQLLDVIVLIVLNFNFVVFFKDLYEYMICYLTAASTRHTRADIPRIMANTYKKKQSGNLDYTKGISK